MKKLLLSIFFFLILIFQSFIPSWATQQEILELREGIRNTTQRVQNQLHDHPDARSVIVLGKTGSGKSTLINLLASKPFTSQQADIGFRVHTDDPLPDFNIGDGNIVGTRFPCAWFDHQNNAVFWDCPGFGDPRGAKADIVNAFSIHQLFKPNIKIVLTIQEQHLILDRATGFLKLLNELTNLFPDNQQINQGLSIIVSKQNEANNIPGYLERQILPLTQQDQVELTQPVRNLLEFLVAHPERISSFPKANGLGIYNPNMQMVRQSINSANYIENPRPNIRVSGDALLYIDSLGKSLNQYIAKYMKNNGHITIIDYCNSLMSDQPDLPLINRFKSLGRDLRDIQNLVVPQNPNVFPERLNAIFGNNFNVSDIRTTIENLGFLGKMRNNITFYTADWTNALLPTIGRIQELTNELERKKEIQDLKNTFQNLTLINQGLTRDLQDSKNNFQNLTVANQGLTREIQDLKNNFQNLTVANQGLTRDLQDSKNNFQNLNKEANELLAVRTQERDLLRKMWIKDGAHLRHYWHKGNKNENWHIDYTDIDEAIVGTGSQGQITRQQIIDLINSDPYNNGKPNPYITLLHRHR